MNQRLWLVKFYAGEVHFEKLTFTLKIYFSQMFLPNINIKISANSTPFCKYSDWRTDWRDALRQPRAKPKSFSLNQRNIIILVSIFSPSKAVRGKHVKKMIRNKKKSLTVFRLCIESVLRFLKF